MSRRRNPDDDDIDLRSEMEDAIVISDRTRGGYAIRFPEGRGFAAEVSAWDTALRNVANWMENRKFWPNVFFVNDHGNVDLLALKYRVGKGGKIGKITDRIVQSWV